MRRLSRMSVVVLALILSVPTLAVLAQVTAAKTKKRAAPPKFNPTETKRIFFDDIFAGDVLQGGRPANMGLASNVPRPSSGGTTTPAAVASTGGGGGAGWSKIIQASAIEDEIKALKLLIDADITTPSNFAGKGYKDARRDFSVVALLFGVISEYDGDVRFKADAPAARDLFARTAANAKVGTQQVFNEAKLRKQELGDLLGGSGLGSKENVDPKTNWAATAWRTPLMQRLEMAMEPRALQWATDKNNFKANKEGLAHEVQIIAAIAEALSKDGMEDADASEYKAFCDRMKKAAMDAAEAVRLDNDEGTRQAIGVVNKVCTECHENYRS